MNVTEERSGQSPCAATISSAPSPFWTVITVAPASLPSSRAASGSRSVPLQARIASSASGSAAGSAVASTCAVKSARPRDAEARARAAPPRAPRAGSSTETSATRARCAANRLPIEPAPATQTLTPPAPAGGPLRAAASPPERELAAAGEPRGAHDQDERHQHADDDQARPGRQVEVRAEHVDAVLGRGEEGVEPADRERADDRAEQAPGAADDEHRERDERQVEVERVDVERQQVDVEAAGEAGERRPRARTRAAAAGRSRSRPPTRPPGPRASPRSIRPKRLRW